MESTITAALGFLAGAMFIGMWLGPAMSRVRTERDRLQPVVDGLRDQLGNEREFSDSVSADADALTDKIAKLTAECVEFQRLAHEAQDEANKNSIERQIELHRHNATKRQLASAKGQITKLKKSLSKKGK